MKFTLKHLLLFEKATESIITNELLNNIVEETKKAINKDALDQNIKDQLIGSILDIEVTPASVRDRLLKELEDSFKKSNSKGFVFVLMKMFTTPNVKIPEMVRELINSSTKEVIKIIG